MNSFKLSQIFCLNTLYRIVEKVEINNDKELIIIITLQNSLFFISTHYIIWKHWVFNFVKTKLVTFLMKGWNCFFRRNFFSHFNTHWVGSKKLAYFENTALTETKSKISQYLALIFRGFSWQQNKVLLSWKVVKKVDHK